MRRWVLVVALLATACGGGADPRVPQAKLTVPACVATGAEVKLDATGSSDPDGRIARYVFSVDGHVKLASNQPYVILPSVTPKIVGGQFQQYAVRVKVVDDDGFAAIAQANFFVVNDVTQCPVGASPADIVMQDSFGPDIVPDGWSTEDIDGDHISDGGPLDVPAPPDFTGLCPDVTGTYKVQIFCFGSVDLELELVLQQQEGCVIAEEYGLVEGSVDETGLVTLSSTFSELNMDDCKGPFDDPENFSLECTSGCTAVFLKM